MRTKRSYKSKFSRFVSVLLLFVVSSLFFFKLSTKSAQAVWFDDTYTYRVKFTFVHNAEITSDRAVTYTLDTAELIAASIMQSDCDDTRFTDGNGKALLYDLTGTCNNASTTYEVIFPNVVNGTNIAYAYYGNAAAINSEIDSTIYTALTPSGGDPAAETAPTTNDEQGPSPISYWNFDEAQGSTANDYSTGSNNDLTITNALWRSLDMCVSGNCLYFDGNADRATKSYSSDTELLPGTTSFTVSAKFKHTSTAGADTLISRADAVAGVGWKIYMDSSGFMCFGIDAVAGSFPNDSACSTTSFADSQWHHLVAVKSSTSSITLYIDGNEIAQDASITSSSLDGTNAPFTFGNDFDNGTNGWFGFIDEVKYYNFAQSTAQIKSESTSQGTVKGVSTSFGPSTNKSLSTGLAGYWKMDEAAADSCSGGEDSCDSSGNSYHGTWTGDTAVTTNAKFGKGTSYDGTSDYSTVRSSAILYGQTEGSVSAWVYSTAADSTANVIYAENNSGGSPLMQLNVSGSNFLAFNIHNGSWNTCEDTVAFTQSRWYHVTGTFSTVDKTIKIYADGVLKTSCTWSGIWSGTITTSTFGNYPAGTTTSWSGYIDESRIYTRTLSATDIESLSNWTAPPVGHWKLDENTGTSVTDSSGFFTAAVSLAGSPSWTPGKYGSNIDFDGVDDYGSGPSDTDLEITNNLSISWWFNFDTVADDSSYMVSYRGSGETEATNELYLLRWDTTSGNDIEYQHEYGASSLNETNTFDTNLNPNIWYHAEIVRDVTANTVMLYINGIKTGSTFTYTNDPTGGTTSTLRFGASSSSADFFDGRLDDVRIYDYARTPKQIIEDLNAGHPISGSPLASQALYWKFDEGQGTTANNSGLASSSNGTLTNIATPATSTSGWTVTGKVNKGLIFDGSNDYVALATANDAGIDFNGTEPFSATAWVYITTMPGTGEQDAIIAKWDDTGNMANYKLYLENDDADTTGNFGVQIYDESASQSLIASQATDSVSTNTWYHVTFTFNGGTTGTSGDLNLYVDGKYVAQNSTNGSFAGLEDTASDLTIGDYDPGDAIATNTPFAGTIDEIKIYTSALSPSEIHIDMNAGSSSALGGVLGTQDDEGFSLPTSAGYWKLDENTGTSVFDSSGQDKTGTLTSGPTWTTGKTGSAISLNGSTSYIDVGTGPSSVKSVAFWVYPTTTTEYFINLTSTTDYIWADTGTVTATGLTSPTIYVNGAISSTITINQWNHVVVTSDTAENASNLDFGRTQDANYLEGKIDNVQLFSSVLTQAQVSYLYNRGAPIAHYKFDECSGETTYNSAITASGTSAGMNGTLTPGASGNTTTGACNSGVSTEMWNDGTIGKFNSALGLDGTDDYTDMGDSAIWDFGAGDFSFSVWVKRGSLTANTDIILAKDNNTAGTRQFFLAILGSNLIRMSYFKATDSEIYLDSTGTIADTTTWHHIVAQKSGSSFNIYLDGKLNTSGTTSGSHGTMQSTTSFFRVGNRQYSGFTDEFNGLVDDVRAFNYAISASQVKILFNGGSAVRFGPQTGSP